MSEMTSRPAPYQVLPYGAEDNPAALDGVLTLVRYYCAAPAIFNTGHHWMVTCTSLRATYECALLDLEGARKDYPKANVVSRVLAFNPNVPEQVDAFVAMVDDEDKERQEMGL